MMNVDIGHIKKHFYPFFFAIFVILIPWEDLQGFKFIDLNNYRIYFLFEKPVYEYANFSNLFDYVKREALWHYLGFFFVKDIGVNVDLYLGMISFFCLYVFSWFVLKYSCLPNVFLLFNPLVVTLCMSQLRSAFAVSLLFVAYQIDNVYLKLLFCISSIFIHTSVSIFLFAFFYIKFFVHKFKNNKFALCLIIFVLSICISLSIGSFRAVILGFIGDRRASYVDASSSVMYMSCWIIFFFFYLFQEKIFFQNVINSYSFMILSIVVVNIFTGGYSTRFLALFFPIIVISIYNLKMFKFFSYEIYFIYSFFQWFYWMKFNIGLL